MPVFLPAISTEQFIIIQEELWALPEPYPDLHWYARDPHILTPQQLLPTQQIITGQFLPEQQLLQDKEQTR